MCMKQNPMLTHTSLLCVLGSFTLHYSTTYFRSPHPHSAFWFVIYMCYYRPYKPVDFFKKSSLYNKILGESGLVFRGHMAGGKLVAVKTVKGEQFLQ